MKSICPILILSNSITQPTHATDPVLRQYTELPYPDFSEVHLKMERMHYGKEDRQVWNPYYGCP